MENNNHKNQNEEAKSLIHQIIDSFTYRYYDKKLKRNISLPASYNEVVQAEKILSEIETIHIEDPYLVQKIESLKEVVKNARKKRFTFTLKMIFVLTIWLFITGFMVYNNFSDISGRYQKEEAQDLYQKDLDYLNGRLKYYNSNPQSKDRIEQISSFKEQIIEHKAITPEQYLENQNKKHRNKKWKELLVFIYSIAIFVLYILSTRTPRFVINKRKKKLMGRKSSNYWGTLITAIWNMEDDEVPEKKSSIFDNDIGKPIYSESAIDGTVTVVGHYGGNTNNGTGGGGMFILMKYSLLVFVLIVAFFSMILFMPLIILYNFISNHHFTFLDRWDQKPSPQNWKTKDPGTIAPTNIEIPFSKMINTGDYYYAKYSGDGFFYYAKVEKELDNKYLVKYYDNYQEEVSANDVCEMNFAIQYLKAFANWENKGLYYPCTVNKIHDMIIVKYEDGVTEQVKEEQLRFI